MDRLHLNFHELQKQLTNKKIHALLVCEQGKLVHEYYRTDECSQKLFKINSITKSIMSTLIGIAIDRGYIEGADMPLSYFFPHIPKEKRHLTIYHLLTMTTGEKWEEFGNGVRFPSFFVRSPNWVNYVLKRPLIERSGVSMNYNSGSSHLLSAILSYAAGKTTEQFARDYLFQPLGIERYEWECDPQGIHIGGFSMMMKPSDLLKIGTLYLQEGNWDGRQIVSSEWIHESWRPLFTTYEQIGSYGFHWWMLHKGKFDVPYTIYFAMGYGGQYIFVVPDLALTAVMSSHMPRKGLSLLRLFVDSLVPS